MSEHRTCRVSGTCRMLGIRRLGRVGAPARDPDRSPTYPFSWPYMQKPGGERMTLLPDHRPAFPSQWRRFGPAACGHRSASKWPLGRAGRDGLHLPGGRHGESLHPAHRPATLRLSRREPTSRLSLLIPNTAASHR